MDGIIARATEKVSIPVERLFEPNCVIELDAPDRPEKRVLDDEDLGELAYSAKRVADGYFMLVDQNIDWGDPNIHPQANFEMFLAIAGLACEIYLKALLFKNRGVKVSERRNHNLYELFTMLRTCRPDIADKVLYDVCPDRIDSFYEELDKSKNIFNEFRYSYELNGYMINISFVKALLNSLKNMTDNLDEVSTP